MRTYAPAAVAPRRTLILLEDPLKRLRRTWVVGVWLASFGALAGCSQGEGETCQVDRDCSSDFVCCRPGETSRGKCYVEGSEACGSYQASHRDAGTSSGDNDAGAPSGETDAGAPMSSEPEEPSE